MAGSNRRFAAIDGAIAEGGWKIVALLRLSPAVPFNLQNYLFGLTRIGFWPYLLTSWIAMMPGTFLYVYVGHLTGEALTYPPALLGTFPSAYQLLPRGRHGVLLEDGDRDRQVEDLYDPALWERMRWGLLSPGQEPLLASLLPDVIEPAERKRIARDHVAKSLARARQLAAALDQPAPAPPPHLGLFLVAGDAVATPRIASVDSRTGRVEIVERGPGDGTVLRTSAVLDEREGAEWVPGLRSPIPWTETLFLFRSHLGLTRDMVFTDNVLYWLLEQPRPSPPRRRLGFSGGTLRKRFVLALALVWSLSLLTSAAQAKDFDVPVTVVVTDAAGNALAGAHVLLEGPAPGATDNGQPRGATTDAKGVASLKARVRGPAELTVEASKAGYTTGRDTLELGPGVAARASASSSL